jgi:hypothetical protein
MIRHETYRREVPGSKNKMDLIRRKQQLFFARPDCVRDPAQMRYRDLSPGVENLSRTSTFEHDI